MKRFDENFTPVDGSALRRIISDTNRDGSWPERYCKAIIPYSLLASKEVLYGSGRTMVAHSGRVDLGLLDLDPAPHFDMVIVDEAHHIRNSNTLSHAAVKYFCDHADSVIFLTATPLQTSDQDLYTLLNVLRPDVILDPGTFKLMARPNPHINQAVHAIRSEAPDWKDTAIACLKEATLTQWGQALILPNPAYQSVISKLSGDGTISREDRIQLIADVESLHSFSGMINRTRRQDIQDFCIRRSHTIESPFTQAQKELHDELLQFEADALSALHGSKSIRFMMSTIRRQAASCIFGLAPFIRAIAQKRLAQVWDDPEVDVQELSLENEADYDSVGKAAAHLLMLADKLPEEDPKFNSLLKIIEEKQVQDNNKIIVFSTFKHTLAYVRDGLKGLELRVAQIDGSVKDGDRYALRGRFMLDKANPDAIDILLFTEVGSEGLDYQFCNTMINYDLPWNPMRIEQRIGRIDRRGQKSDVVHIFNLITSETIDAEIYHRCLLRIGVFENSIGECSAILGEMSQEIQNIVFAPSLTDEERKVKLEQMADNEVRKVQELRCLEEDEKQLFGFNLSEHIMSKEIQEAENPWITPNAIQYLLEEYLKARIGPGNYVLGEGHLKTLRLSAEARRMLLEDYRKLPANRSEVRRSWELYLKSSKPNCAVTFDSNCAEQNRSTFFITNTHPLAKQAAEYFDISDVFYIGASISSSELPPGIHPFSVYAWEYVGYRPQRKLMGICDNPDVQRELLDVLQLASNEPIDTSQYKSSWERLEGTQLRRWNSAKDDHKRNAEASYRFKNESLSSNFAARKRILQQQIADAYDDNILRMRRAELENMEAKHYAKIAELRRETEKADIHTRLLVNGIITIKEG